MSWFAFFYPSQKMSWNYLSVALTVLPPLVLVLCSREASAHSFHLIPQPLKTHRCLVTTHPCLLQLVLDWLSPHLPRTTAQFLTTSLSLQTWYPTHHLAMQSCTVLSLVATPLVHSHPFTVLLRSTARDYPDHPLQKQVSGPDILDKWMCHLSKSFISSDSSWNCHVLHTI